jgi:methyl-galactoside transport system ATP-binding protein
MIYISHKMDEIKRIADDVTVMRDGTYIGTWPAAEMTTDQIIAKMVGRELTNIYPAKETYSRVKSYHGGQRRIIHS